MTAVLAPPVPWVQSYAVELAENQQGPGPEAAADDALARARQIADSLSKLEGRRKDAVEAAQVEQVEREDRPSSLAPTPPPKDDAGAAVSAADATASVARTRPQESNSSSVNRASTATLDSMLTSGDTVYEDAQEDMIADGEEHAALPSLHLFELTRSPVLFGMTLPASVEPVETSRAELQHSPLQQHGPATRSTFEEQAILLRRRATLQAQAESARRANVRQSFPVRPNDVSPALGSARRHSAVPSSTQVPLATRRASTAAMAPVTPPRPQGHLKPLVLTPTRTVQAPLTSPSPTTPPRRRASVGFPERGSFALMRQGSNMSDISPSDRSTSSPRSPSKRRSIGYVDSHDAAGRRGRTASQDTTGAYSTDDSALSRSSSFPQPESPDSSVEGWSDEKDAHGAGMTRAGSRGSLRLSDDEWERDHPRKSSRTGSLEMVEEDAALEQKTPMPESSSSVGLAPAIDFTAATPSTVHAPGSPATVTSPPLARHKAKYGEHWVAGTVSDSAAEESDAAPPSRASPNDSPVNPSRSASPMPRKGKPIVIQSVTARSSAANARRSQRLSQIEPPVGEGGQRLSRVSRRLSSGPGGTPPPAASPRQQPATHSPDHTQRRLSSPRAHVQTSQTLSGLAIWPPPAETKTMTLARPFAYASDAESAAGLSGRESETDDEAFGAKRSSARTGRRRPSFEPRNPRAAPEDEEYGPESWLEVLLTEEPPARTSRRSSSISHADPRRGSLTGATSETLSRKGSAPALDGTPSASSRKSGGLTKKLLGGLRTKAPEVSSPSKKPVSIAPQHGGSRRAPLKPRPIVSGPLELEAASTAMAAQRSTGSLGSATSLDFAGAGTTTRSSSAMSNRVGGRPMVHYASVGAAAYVRQATFADDSREELASLHFDSEDDLRASLDAVFLRRSPKGTTAAGDVPPALPSKNWHRRYGSVSSIETLSSTTGSVMSSSGRGGHSRRGSLSDGSLAFPSASRAVNVERLASTERSRDVWRAQALER